MSLFVTVLAGSEAVAGELKPLTMSHPARSISNTAMGADSRPEMGVNGGTMSNIARKAASVASTAPIIPMLANGRGTSLDLNSKELYISVFTPRNKSGPRIKVHSRTACNRLLKPGRPTHRPLLLLQQPQMEFSRELRTRPVGRPRRPRPAARLCLRPGSPLPAAQARAPERG